MQKPRTTIHTLNHLIHSSLVHFFQLLHLIFLHPSQPVVPFLHDVFQSSLKPCFLTPCSQQLTVLPFDLIFFTISFIIFILCCRFISSSSVENFCILCLSSKVYSLNLEKIIAQQSSPHLRILHFLLLRTRLHSRGAPLTRYACSSFAVFHHVPVRILFLNFTRNFRSTCIHLQ